MTPSPSRDALRRAIADRDAAKEALAHATAAERAGIDLLAAAEKELKACGDLDGVIVQHRAKRIKDAAKGGPVADLKLPAELVERRAARDEAREHVVANKVAHASLVESLKRRRRPYSGRNIAFPRRSRSSSRQEANQLAGALQTAWNGCGCCMMS